jgi:DNA mismatch repair protein MutL
MSAIRILPERVASQIAAGEVVERPASVVRELTDNSIDAGAQKIFIALENGGKSLIRVADDGTGMGRDDLLLCLERHATSKISSIPDLFNIQTLGFRGEALPSIAAVSRMEILSRMRDELIGYRLKVAGGKIKSLEEAGPPPGTTVEVRDLFFNTPARKKFLRTPSTESDHILETVARIALPFISIHLRLDEGKRNLLSLPASRDEISRLSALFGREAAASMVRREREEGALRVRCYVASPEMTRARGDRIFVYVNKRSVRDKLLTHAVMEGYGQRLMRGRYPQAVVFIDLDPSVVDVNVHPTKQEVRFRESRHVHETLRSAVEESLGRKLYPVVQRETAPRKESVEHPLSLLHTAEKAAEYEVHRVAEAVPDRLRAQPPAVEHEPGRLFDDRLEIIGQLKKTYVLCQVEDGLLMIDQHAAHERIVYEKLKACTRESRPESQPFLIPPSVEFSPKDARLLSRHLGRLAELGVEMEPFGGTTFLVRSVPSVMVDANWMEFIKDLSPILEKNDDLSREDALDAMLSVMACHGAVRAGQPLSFDEMRDLVEQLHAAQLPGHCPHGRPVAKKFTYYDIEKMFKRIV